jgi:hypothetical protein
MNFANFSPTFSDHPLSVAAAFGLRILPDRRIFLRAYSDLGNHKEEEVRAVDHRAAAVVDRRTWDAGREGTFRRVACRDILEVGHCTDRDNLHLRILSAVGTAVVVLDPDQLAGTVVGNSLEVRAVLEDLEEDEVILVLLRDVLVLLRGVSAVGVEEARVSLVIRLAYCLRRLSLRLRELVFETSHYYSLWCCI